MKKLNVITFEDATSDTFMYIKDVGLSCKLDLKKVYLELLYGDKIPVETYKHEVGGNAANVAAGVASLGLRSAVFGTIGDDFRGVDILRLLKKRNVETKYLKPVRSSSSNISVIITYKGERTILTHHPKRGSNMGLIPRADWYYISQAQNKQLYERINKQAESTGARIAFNPGARMIKREKVLLKKILKKTDLFFVNKEEASEILGRKRDSGRVYIKKLLTSLYAISKGSIVITDGSKGAYAYDGEYHYFIKPFPSKRIEPTGAGDAFASAVLSAIIKGHTLSKALVWGSLNSAHVIRQIGSQVGLLTYKKMEALYKRHSTYKTQKI